MVGVFRDALRRRIQRTGFYLDKCAEASFMDVVGLAADLTHIEGLAANHGTPSPFVCLLQRMCEVKPTPELLGELIAQTDLKYLRFFAIVYLRLSEEDPVMVHGAIDVGLGDFRRLRVRAPDGSVTVQPVDVVCEMLVAEPTLFEIPLPSLPSRANTAAVSGQLTEWPRKCD
jgi:pre-mRNA-splicing factor 38A